MWDFCNKIRIKKEKRKQEKNKMAEKCKRGEEKDVGSGFVERQAKGDR